MRKRDIWETPRNIAILAAAIAALSGSIAAWIGYKIGSTPQLIIINIPPQPLVDRP
jgi:hypothetical protein